MDVSASPARVKVELQATVNGVVQVLGTTSFTIDK